jgi:Protein of unknown function (DUF3574)
VLALAACSEPPAPAPCPLPGQQRLAIVELFFGRSIPGRAPLTEAEWSDFAARVIAQQFPDGFTVFDGDGQWFDQATGRTVHERSKILYTAADPESDLKSRIGAVVEAYRKQFHQRSVGIVTHLACAAF